ncbi:MAG: hypothetical protein GY810_17520 [Aureispira sp.]|nr:hypothetical protein [Aureispira sp.]
MFLVQLVDVSNNIENLLINLPKDKVTLKTSYNDQILIKTTVRLSVEDDKLMDYLADKGRYDVMKENKATNHLALMSTPQLYGEIAAKNGVTIKEHISYTIYVPNKNLQQIRIKTPKTIEISVLGY